MHSGPPSACPASSSWARSPFKIAWGGRSHLAAWSGGCQTAAGWAGGLWCARLGRDGVPLDSVFVDSLYVPQATQVVSAWASDLLGPALVADPAGWFVAWGQTILYDQPRQVLAARIDSLGARVDPAGILVGEADALRGRPDLATSGDQYLVVWAGQSNADNRVDVYAARVSVNGTVLDAQPIRITNDEAGGTHPRVVFDGVFYRVAWQRSSAGGPTECWWATVSPAGFVAEPPARAAAGVVSPPALARTTGTALLVGLSWVHPEWQVPRAATLAVAPAEARLQLQLASKTANPIRDQARFDLTLASPAVVEARVYDVRGRVVQTLYTGSAGTGIHAIVWDGSTTTGRQAPAGSISCTSSPGAST